ncbi:Protein LOW PSII ACCUMULATION 1 [Chlorella vulgaris]
MAALTLSPTLARRPRPFVALQRRPLYPSRASGPQCASRSRLSCRATSSPQQNVAASTAKQAVELGLEAFEAGDTDAALTLFQKALSLQPDADEARAAAYNSACAHTRLRQWEPAVEAIKLAVNTHGLKLSVALNDADLEPLRERREWLAALAELRGGINEQQLVQLRSEAKAPFRLTRIIFVGGLAVGAALGLFIITARLLAAVQGGEGAPDLQETLQNFGINAAALAVLSFFVLRDVSSQNKDQQVITREEALGKLQISLGSDRVIPLAAFRGTTRPVIIAGSRGQISRALAAAEPCREALRERGISVVPIQLSAEDVSEKLRQLKAEFGGAAAAPASKGFGGAASGSSKAAPEAAAVPAAASGLTSKDRRWQLKPHNDAEWQQWLLEQKQASGINADTIYVQVQLDGTVRASGAGMPPWTQFLDDIPELGDIRTKVTDGIGR